MSRSINTFLPPKQKKRLNAPPTSEPWVWITREILNSAAWRSLSEDGRRVLDRVMVEHMAHGGLENGRLKVTYRDFQAYGALKRAVKPAIEEVVRAGFVRIQQTGRRVCGEDRGAPAQYRLTWLPMATPGDHANATNEWKGFVPLAEPAPKRKLNSAHVIAFAQFLAAKRT